MPAKKGSTSPNPRVSARNARVAAQVVAGMPVGQIAAVEGISRSLASAIANSDPVQQICGQLIQSESEHIGILFAKSLVAIEEALKADRIGVVDKEIANFGPDHYARLTAAKRLLEYVLAGRAMPRENDASATKAITASELRKLLADHAKMEPNA